jgi:hypothetical protein
MAKASRDTVLIRTAHSSHDREAIMRGAHAFAAAAELPDLMPPDPKDLEVAVEAMLWGGATVLLAEVYGETVGGIGYGIAPYQWDLKRVVGEEIFWWAYPGAPPIAAAKLWLTMLQHWTEAGVSVKILHRLMNSPEKVDAVYRRAGTRPVQVTYMGAV